MKPTLLLIPILFTLTHAQPAQVKFLSDIYKTLNSVYSRYIHKRASTAPGPIDPNVWNAITQPSDVVDSREPVSATYDFIIVGSGSAGSVIANRLSEVPHWRVLLLEAGKGENEWSLVPLAAPTMCFTPYNWGAFAEYQPGLSDGFNDRRMWWPRGRALGGTSVINFMIYTRGNRFDYDRWGAANPGWSYPEVLPYFIKSENATLRDANDEVHGHGGYFSVEDIYQSDLALTFVEAGQELGLPRIDYNANYRSYGVSTIQATVLRGQRLTAARAFLHPIRDRPNLQVLTSAFVTKILIDPESRRAYGVEYDRFGKKYRVGATKEVVLSAGTFQSPQLLMLAGIGPKEHLEELEIPVLEDLPVGHNLQDHLTYPGLSFQINQQASLNFDLLLNRTSIFAFLDNGTGPFTSLGGVEAIGYVRTELSRDPEDRPDMELLFMDGSLSTDYGLFNRRWMNIRDDVYNAVWKPTENTPTWTIFPMLLHPKSVGFLKLKSRNPYEYPLLYGNFFSDPEDHDIDTFVASIRIIERLAQTEALQKYGSVMNPRPIPSCRQHEFDSDDYWKCALRALSVTLHHQVGTVKMGPPDDPTSVVNNELKVYGIGGLRVADCSVVPNLVGAHMHAVSTMVGEKAADYIKSDWGLFTNH